MEKEKQGEQEVKLPKPILIEDLGMMFPTEKSNQKSHYGIFKCGFCGTEFRTQIKNVKIGGTKSCGCYGKKILSEGTYRKHNLSYTRLYKVWGSIRGRTLNPKNKNYKYYGGRGIIICEEWKNDFMTFYNWALLNGYEENKGLSIDRIDNDGNYCPDNCRWTTSTIQTRNQRLPKNNSSGYKGVCLVKRDKIFTARICVNKKSIYLGSFLTPLEGAIAYNNYIIENSLEGFILNEIPERLE